MEKEKIIKNESRAMETSDHLEDKSNTPIIGYNKVTWGASIQEVEEHYPNIKDQGIDEFGKRTFREYVDSNGMIYRWFYFFQDKLYMVFVSYESHLSSALNDKLISIYGKFDSEISYYKFKEYNENLSILLNERTHYCSVTYANPTIMGQIEKMKSEQIEL
jgi:hypothetical protein